MRRWRRASSLDPVELYTCARPGRSKGPSGSIPDSIVDQWVNGLPYTDSLAIISLLGRKHGPQGQSEYNFYSFCGGNDTESEREGQQSFQEWLNHRHGDKKIQVVEFPTYDFQPIPEETLDSCTSTIEDLLERGFTVILVDSGGETRTRVVCNHMEMVEDPARIPR